MSAGDHGARRPPLGGVRHLARHRCRNGQIRQSSGAVAAIVTSLTRGTGGVESTSGDPERRLGDGTPARGPAAFPGPRSGRSDSRSASPCILVGLIVNPQVIVADRRGDRGRLRLPLGPRRRRRNSAREPVARSSPSAAAASRRRAADPGRPGDGDAEPRPASASRATGSSRARRSASAPSSAASSRVPALGFMIVPAFKGQGYPKVDLGPARELPGGQVVVIATFFDGPEDGEVSRRTAYIRNNGLLERRAELHDHLEPLRAPRLPGAAERPDAGRPDEEVDGKTGSSVTLIPAIPPAASAARATAASTTPRATAPRARRCARSTATQFAIVDGHLDPRQAVQRRRRSRARARTPRSTRTSSPARASTSTAGSRSSTRCSRRTDGDCRAHSKKSAAAPAARGRDQLPDRLARGALRPRRRRSSTSSSARSRRHGLVAHARLGDADRLPRAGARPA